MYEDEEDDIDDNQYDDSQQGDQQQQQPLDSSQQQQAPAVPVIDYTQIASTVAQTMQEMQRQQQAPTQLTPEQQAEHYQIWNPDESFVNDFNKLTDPDLPYADKVKLFHAMRDGMVNQSFRASQLLVEQQLAQFEERMAPALSIAQKAQSQQVYKEFHGKYPELKEHGELVDAITAQLSAQGFKPKSKDEAYEKVAKAVESVLKKSNPTFALKSSGGRVNMPSMTKTNMGGFGSSSGATHQSTGSGAKRGGLAKIFQP